MRLGYPPVPPSPELRHSLQSLFSRWGGLPLLRAAHKWVLTTGVIEQHDVVQGDVALSLLRHGRFKDDLWRQRMNYLTACWMANGSTEGGGLGAYGRKLWQEQEIHFILLLFIIFLKGGGLDCKVLARRNQDWFVSVVRHFSKCSSLITAKLAFVISRTFSSL